MMERHEDKRRTGPDLSGMRMLLEKGQRMTERLDCALRDAAKRSHDLLTGMEKTPLSLAAASSGRKGEEQGTARMENVQQRTTGSERAVTTADVRAALIGAGEATDGTGVMSQAPAPAAAPEELAEAIVRALGGLAVQLDGQAVGRLVAPAVDEQLGRAARARRYTE